MGKNKEEFMKDREKDFQTNGLDNDSLSNNELRVSELIGELEEAKHLLSKCKTLIADMVMYNIEIGFVSERNDDVMKQSQELLTELKDY